MLVYGSRKQLSGSRCPPHFRVFFILFSFWSETPAFRPEGAPNQGSADSFPHGRNTGLARWGARYHSLSMAGTLDEYRNAVNRPAPVPPSMFCSFSTWRLQPNRALASPTSLASSSRLRPASSDSRLSRLSRFGLLCSSWRSESAVP